MVAVIAPARSRGICEIEADIAALMDGLPVDEDWRRAALGEDERDALDGLEAELALVLLEEVVALGAALAARAAAPADAPRWWEAPGAGASY